jgi:hypothetical protein
MNKYRQAAKAWMGGALMLMLLLSSPARALEVQYAAVDVADSVVGVDRWRYDYSFVGSLAEFEGLSLLFDFSSRAGLQVASPPDSTALDYVLEQPSTALQADGLFTVSAVRPIAGEKLNFSVSFDALSGVPPGAQRYELFDADFNVTGTALTVAVPEPPSGVMLLAALAVLMPLMRRRLARPA